jgi:hypothetical protein
MKFIKSVRSAMKPMSKVDRAAGFVERLHPDHWGNWGQEELPPHRYCWPPV